MRTKFTATSPDDIEFSMTVTMPLKEWIILNGQLKREWPSTDLSYAINDVVRQAQAKFQPQERPAPVTGEA